MAEGTILIAATNIEGPMGVALRRYWVTCSCVLPEDGETHYTTDLALVRKTAAEDPQVFTRLIGDHKAAIAANDGRCRCELPPATVEQVRRAARLAAN